MPPNRTAEGAGSCGKFGNRSVLGHIQGIIVVPCNDRVHGCNQSLVVGAALGNPQFQCALGMRTRLLLTLVIGLVGVEISTGNGFDDLLLLLCR
jgi:hypothetical protein